jgi:hypothetical protein
MSEREMNSVEATAALIDVLEAAHVEYMVVGAFSANAYGVGRSTNDADLVVSVGSDRLRELVGHLGPEFRLDPQMQLEGFTGSFRNVLTYLPTDFQIELFRLNNEDEHHRERFQRRRRILLREINREAWIPTAEDVVIQKLRWQRRKDLDDVLNILAVNRSSLDWDYIDHWTGRHGTRTLLQELLQSLPNLDDLNET